MLMKTIIEHVSKMQKDINENGANWAYMRCYGNKCATFVDAYILGYTDCGDHLTNYIKHNKLDKLKKVCYTSKKAHKK
jgi:hypothetical protein